MPSTNMRFNIEITFSKIFSILMLLASVYLSIELESVTPFSVVAPIVGGMIASKHYNDRKTAKPTNKE